MDGLLPLLLLFPAVLQQQRYTIAGHCRWELVTGQVPYSAMTPLQAAVGVVQKGLRPEIPPTCPPAIAELMRACWTRNPQDRPTFEVLKQRVEALYETSAAADKAGPSSVAGNRGFFAKFKQGGKRP